MTKTFGSLFSGIGGFDLGLERAGMQCAWQIEIDAHCQKLLEQRFPNAKRYTDVKTFNGAEPVDIICGGFPCQDLSVAGKRAGLDGKRSGLWFEFIRIIGELTPRWVVIENVPGLLSSNKGQDFAVILQGLAECGYSVAWRILDARYFGVAQRRRRVFIVASLGNGSCAEILFESEGVSRDIKTRGEARKEVAGTVTDRVGGSGAGWARYNETEGLVAGTLSNRSNGGGFPGTDEAIDGYVQVAGTLTANWGGLDRPAGNANELDFCIPVAPILHTGLGHHGWSIGDQDFNLLQPVGFSADRDGGDAGVLSPTLKHGGSEPQHHNAFKKMAVAFGWNKSASQSLRVGNQIDALQSSPTSNPAVAWHENKAGQLTVGEIAKALRAGASYSYQGVGVRRLTPTECEILQGFPQEWTEGFADSTRYRMLGNAVCVNVTEWIGKRIMELS